MAVEVGEAYVTILPSAKGFAAHLGGLIGGDLDRAGKDAGDRAGEGFLSSFGGKLAGAAKLAGIAIAAVGTAAGIGLVKSVSAASHLNEAMSQVQFVFGDSAKEIQDWSKTAATGFGQSQRAALEAAGGLGNFFQGMGISQVAAVGMSKSVIELAGDIASFADISPDEALQALQSGLAGEVEPLRRFGISLDEVSLKQKAQQLGLGDGKGVLDASAKAQAAYAIIMEKSSRIHGDFTRTASGLANQQRAMAAQWENLKAAIGVGFLPVAAEAAAVITTKILPALQRFAEAAGPKIGTAIADFIATLRTGLTGDVTTPLERAALVVRSFATTAIEAFKGIVAGFRSGFDGINVDGIADDIGRGIARIVEFLSGVDNSVRAFVQAFTHASDGITSSGFNGAVESLGMGFRDLYDWLKTKIPEAFDVFKTAVGEARDKIVEIVTYVTDHKDAFETITAGAVAFAAALKAIITAQKGLSILSDALSLAAAAIAGGPFAIAAAAIIAIGVAAFVAYQKFQPFHDAADAIGRTIRDIAVPAFHGFLDVIGTIGSAVGTAFGAVQGAVEPVKNAFLDVAGSIRDFLQPAIDWIGQNVTPTIEAAFGAAAAIIARVVDVFQIADTALRAVGNVLVAILSPAARLLVESFRVIGEVVQGLLVIFAGFFAFVVPIWNTFARIVADVVVGAFNQIKATVEEVLGIFRGFFEIIDGIFSGDWRQVWEGVKQIFASAWGFIIDTIKNAVTLFLQIFTDIDFKGFLDKIVALPGVIMSALSGLLPAVGAWAASLIGVFFDLQVQIFSFLAGLGLALVQKGVDLLQGLLNGIISFLPALVAWFGGLAGAVLDWLGSDPIGWLLDAGAKLITGLYNGILSVLGTVTGFFAGLPGNIISWIADTFGTLQGKGSDLINGLLSGIQNVIGEVISFFSSLPGNIISWISDTFGTLQGKGSDLIHGLLSGIRNVIGEVTSFFSSLPSNVSSWMGGTYNTLVSQGGDIIRGFIDGIVSWVSSIYGHISAIPGQIVSAIGNLGDRLYGKGQEIIEGLIDGIESLKDAAVGAVQSAVAAAVSSVPGGSFFAGLIPKFAAGGYVTKPTLAVVGESGPEYIIPADLWNGMARPLPAAAYQPAEMNTTTNGPISQVFYNSNVDAAAAAKELSWTLLTRGR